MVLQIIWLSFTKIGLLCLPFKRTFFRISSLASFSALSNVGRSRSSDATKRKHELSY